MGVCSFKPTLAGSALSYRGHHTLLPQGRDCGGPNVYRRVQIFSMQKALKILRLALCASSPDGEWRNAAVKFAELLRKNKELADHFLGEKASRQGNPTYYKEWSPPTGPRPRPAPPPPPSPEEELESAKNTVLWFGKHKGSCLKDVPADYLLWLLNNATSLSARIKHKIRLVLNDKT